MTMCKFIHRNPVFTRFENLISPGNEHDRADGTHPSLTAPRGAKNEKTKGAQRQSGKPSFRTSRNHVFGQTRVSTDHPAASSAGLVGKVPVFRASGTQPTR